MSKCHFKLLKIMKYQAYLKFNEMPSFICKAFEYANDYRKILFYFKNQFIGDNKLNFDFHIQMPLKLEDNYENSSDFEFSIFLQFRSMIIFLNYFNLLKI